MNKNIQKLLEKAHSSSFEINTLPLKRRNDILITIAELLIKNSSAIIKENKKDLKAFNIDDPLYDRLLLTKERIKAIASDVKNVKKLKDPTGIILEKKVLPNKLQLKKVTVPIGTIGIIYEARPNVTIDTATLCIKSGNAVILRGSSSAIHSNTILVKILKEALKKNKVSSNAIELFPIDRKYMKDFLNAENYIDVIIPRGSEKLIQMVRKNASVPVIETGAGVVHTYIDNSANIKNAIDIVYNAKTQRPSVCNALDTLILHKKHLKTLLPKIGKELEKDNVEIRADSHSYKILTKSYPSKLLKKAKPSDFGVEYLSLKMSIKTVNNIDEAIKHIQIHSSKHSEAIVSNNNTHIEKFLKEVDAAAVYSNSSTRFTDGSQFGLGAEIGISTQKLHARGPMGLEELTTYKWIIKGKGQIRS